MTIVKITASAATFPLVIRCSLDEVLNRMFWTFSWTRRPGSECGTAESPTSSTFLFSGVFFQIHAGGASKEAEDKEAYFMGTQSQARKRFKTYCSIPALRNRFNWRQSPYYTPNRDRSQSNPRAQNTNPKTFTNAQQTAKQTFTRCVGCRCTNCAQVKEDFKDIKMMLE